MFRKSTSLLFVVFTAFVNAAYEGVTTGTGSTDEGERFIGYLKDLLFRVCVPEYGTPPSPSRKIRQKGTDDEKWYRFKWNDDDFDGKISAQDFGEEFIRSGSCHSLMEAHIKIIDVTKKDEKKVLGPPFDFPVHETSVNRLRELCLAWREKRKTWAPPKRSKQKPEKGHHIIITGEDVDTVEETSAEFRKRVKRLDREHLDREKREARAREREAQLEAQRAEQFRNEVREEAVNAGLDIAGNVIAHADVDGDCGSCFFCCFPP